jgi:SOS-response transcriptional repressor LexA
MLTKKQRDLLVFIHERLSKSDVAPSFRRDEGRARAANRNPASTASSPRWKSAAIIRTPPATAPAPSKSSSACPMA